MGTIPWLTLVVAIFMGHAAGENEDKARNATCKGCRLKHRGLGVPVETIVLVSLVPYDPDYENNSCVI